MTNHVIRFEQGPTSSGRLNWYAAILDCGHKWFDKNAPYSPITSVEVETEVECETCAAHHADEQWLQNLDYAQVHHARFDPRFGGIYRFYRLAKTSPSNFMIIGSVAATPAIDAMLKTKTNCGPLSPTEQA